MSNFTNTNTGIVLNSPATQNPSTLVAGGHVTNITAQYNGDAVYGTNAAAWNFINYGIINATGAASSGMALEGGGTVTNVVGALIAGVAHGVFIGGGAGTVSNFGTIAGSGMGSDGVYLTAGGTVSNAQSGLISGVYAGVLMKGTAGLVNNFGTIAGTGTAGYIDGVYMNVGTVVNGAPDVTTALISSMKYGVVMAGTAASTVSNFGTIAGGIGNVEASFSPVGVYIKGRGTVINGAPDATSALISAVNYAIKMAGSAVGTVTNFGTITSTVAENPGTGLYPDAIFMDGFGTVANGAPNATSALISAGHRGIYISGTGVSTVSNFGTIRGIGTYSSGIYLSAAGIVGNAQGALIAGSDDGLVMQGTAASTLNNFGTIIGGGTGNPGVNAYPIGVYIKGSGTVVNGASNATSALIRGANIGLSMERVGGTGAVTNFGTIIGGNGATGLGIYVGDRGSVVNGASNVTSALISGGRIGVQISGISGTVINYGNVVATAANGVSVNLSAGGVTNFGTVTAGANGIGVYMNSGQVTNFGTILARSATAVYVRYGVFVNHGLVEGAVSGIVLSTATGTSASGTVTVAGTVIGATGISVAPASTGSQTVTVMGTVVGTSGTAVSLTPGGNNRLILHPGALFQGLVDGGSGGTSVLEIAAGALAGQSGGAGQGGVAYVSLGSVTNFSALQIDPSAMLDGSGALSFNTLINQGQVIVGSGDSLALGTVVAAANTGIIDLRTGGMIDFKGPVAGQTLMFNPAGGTAAIDQAAAFAATVTDFAVADTIDLTHFVVAGKSFANNALMLTDTLGNTATLAIVGSFSTGSFHTTPDGGTGTNITIACYCRGTRILTDRGEVPVEELATGDKVVTLSGAARPIRWIGRRSYAGRFAFGQRHILPVCITAGALDGGVPRRDLWVSPNHALYLEEVLIEARDLINGISIFQSERVEAIQYFHIELDSHDVILAEGAAAESFIDDDSRGLFHNAHEYRALYPDAAAGPARYCAPRHDQGYAVERARTRIARRAGLAAVTETPPPGLAATARSIEVRRSPDDARLTRAANTRAELMVVLPSSEEKTPPVTHTVARGQATAPAPASGSSR